VIEIDVKTYIEENRKELLGSSGKISIDKV
jgi:hypothetical protein